MLLLIVLALVDLGSSARMEICHGSDYKVPTYYTPPLFKKPIYYKPRGEERILAVNAEGESQHKRFLVTSGSILFKELTEQDDGAMLFYGRSNVELEIVECKEPHISVYGESLSMIFPPGTEYLEFTQISSSSSHIPKPQVIWNRTDASLAKGRVNNHIFEINNVKQKDSGFYNFRGLQGGLIRWKRLIVEESYHHATHMEGDKVRFFVRFSKVDHVLFKRQGSDREESFDADYMDPRMEIQDSYLSFWDVKYEDSGTYKFIDDEGFLALRMELEVDYPPLPTWVYIIGLVIIVLCTVCCCCCVKKCCCKKSSSKRSSPETEGAAPRVFYHDSNQPTQRTQPTQPVIPLLSREPRAITTDPPMYNSVVDNMNLPPSNNIMPSSQITAPGGLGPTSTPMIPTSSDSDPKFEFKGSIFPSAPPLSSGTSIQDVYTSDKLNFL